MKRYSLSIFKNPEMHDRGGFIKYKDFIDYKNHANAAHEHDISLKKYWKDEYSRVLALAEDAQRKFRDMESRVTRYQIICTLFSLGFILSFFVK